jgi:hypothetical protein
MRMLMARYRLGVPEKSSRHVMADDILIACTSPDQVHAARKLLSTA